ncbi:MAG: hypothetical protein AB7V50_04840 [Vampirovibrionia bacterium]
MKHKSGLDAHIVKKYATISTISTNVSSSNDPEKIWNSLGLMAAMNVATLQMKRA